MNCEEFEAMGLDADRDPSLNEVERVAAREHGSTCSRCAALQDSWQAARIELRAFADDTALRQSPSRVEMRLRQEFRRQHGTFKVRRTAVVAAWVLATAALLAGAVGWSNWRRSQQEEAARRGISAPGKPQQVSNAPGESGLRTPSGATDESYVAIPGEDGEGDFTPLPGTLAAESDEAAVVRVRMQRGTLVTLGFLVNEERAGEWIQVDLLVGNDGLPQAVRLAR